MKSSVQYIGLILSVALITALIMTFSIVPKSSVQFNTDDTIVSTQHLTAQNNSVTRLNNTRQQIAEEFVSANAIAGKTVMSEISLERWDLLRIEAIEAWRITPGDRNVITAVLDTGIDETHIKLNNKVMAAVNFSNSPTTNDLNGHGTHIAGIIAGNIDYERKSRGLAYESKLLNVKIADDAGCTNNEAIAKGVIWAVDKGANIINISVTLKESSVSLEQAVKYAWKKGAVVLAAAGNNFSPERVYPAALDEVIAVSATDKEDKLAFWANYGDWVDIAAPGEKISSTTLRNGYVLMSGTSQAAALVSGDAALLFALAEDTNHNGLLNDEVVQLLKQGVDYIPDNSGKGVNYRINALKALQMSRN